MKSFRETASIIAKNVTCIFVGILFWLFIVCYTVMSLPVYLYRLIIIKMVSPCFRPEIGKAANIMGNTIGAEFLKPGSPPRCSMAVNLVVDGEISYEEFQNLIETNWIKAKGQDGNLLFPEFQQYLDLWMGFMFWKPVQDFQLTNHVKLHEIKGNGDDEESEQFLCQLIEKFLNEPYPSKKSPWEMHLIHNYKNSSLPSKSDKMCVVLLKMHHSMADGFAVTFMVLEQLFGISMAKSSMARPTQKPNQNYFSQFLTFFTYPVHLLHEAGNIMFLAVRRRTPLHIPDSKKTWTQLYARSPLISISQIKHIKNTFGVSFYAVLNACLSAGLSKTLEKLVKKSGSSIPKDVVMGVPVPASRHPRKLRNNVLGIAFAIPSRTEIDPLERLRTCEENIQRVKNSPMPILSGVGLKIFSTQLSPVSRYILKNRYIPSGISSFPGPGIEVGWNGRTALAMDFVAGGMVGDAGVVFMALSYVDKIRISVAAENAVLSREQVNDLMSSICNEFDVLYQLAVDTSQKSTSIQLA